jgi:hypothetical protein
MDLATFIALLSLVTVVTCAVRYLVKAKQRGVKCVGCPDAASCSVVDAASCSAIDTSRSMDDTARSGALPLLASPRQPLPLLVVHQPSSKDGAKCCGT